MVACAGDCLRDCHSGLPFWDFYFVSRKPSDARKEATDNQVWFSANQKLIPLIVRDAIAILWRARRSYNHCFASADALEPLRTTANKEAAPSGPYLIASGSDDPHFNGVIFQSVTTVSLALTLVLSRSEEIRKARRRSLACNGFCL